MRYTSARTLESIWPAGLLQFLGDLSSEYIHHITIYLPNATLRSGLL